MFAADNTNNSSNHVAKTSADETVSISDTFALEHDFITISLSERTDKNGLKEVTVRDRSNTRTTQAPEELSTSKGNPAEHLAAVPATETDRLNLGFT